MTGAREPIRSLVQRDPVAVGERLTLRQVAAVLAADDIGAALVEGDGRRGIVSERDVTRALADDADPDVVWSADVMSEDLVTAHSDEPIQEVALRMIDEAIRHIAVVDGDSVVGVVSSRDVFAVLARELIDAG